MKFRRLVFWAHLITGVAAGVVIFVMCVTGVLLAFERQINDWADTANCAPVQSFATRQPLASILGKVEERTPPTALTVYANPRKPIAVAFGREQTIFFDPGSGEEIGNSSRRSRAFFAGVELYHRSLGEALQHRGPGRALTGLCNLLFLGLVVSGLYLWLPKSWQWVKLHTSLLYRRGLTGKARYWNWHNATGVWCAIPLFFIVLCSVIMSYQWANNLLYRMTGSEIPKPGGRVRVQAVKAAIPHVDSLFAKAEKQVPGWQSISLRLDSARAAVFTIDRGNGGQPNKRDQLVLNKMTGEVIRWEPFESLSLGRRLRSLVRFTHTGEAGGIAGQIIAALASAGGAFLVWTGLALALMRLKRSVSRRNRRTAMAEALPQTSAAD